MKTIIAGSRGLGFPDVVAAAAACPWTISLVVSGGARGVDRAGEAWANQRGLPVEVYPADWKRADGSVDLGAGFARNTYMAFEVGAEALLAVWDGRSRGTAHMIAEAERAGLRVFVWRA